MPALPARVEATSTSEPASSSPKHPSLPQRRWPTCKEEVMRRQALSDLQGQGDGPSTTDGPTVAAEQ